MGAAALVKWKIANKVREQYEEAGKGNAAAEEMGGAGCFSKSRKG